jgi:hypothetical protein
MVGKRSGKEKAEQQRSSNLMGRSDVAAGYNQIKSC